VRSPWDGRIARAQELSGKHPEAAELLDFYGRLAAFQKTIFEDVMKSGTTDPVDLSRYFPKLREIVECHGPALAVEYARDHLRSGEALDDFLIAHWDDPSIPDTFARFYSRVLLQPFAEALAARGAPPSSEAAGICPFCGARAMAAVLRGEGDGAKRFLLCSLCATEWEFLRIRCPGCGEQNKDHLPVFTTGDFDYIRVEACDTCKVYLKSIDLTKNGLAVPVADELASVSLNVWAEEHGYTKYEPNLLGL
jgi:FdhE protein